MDKELGAVSSTILGCPNCTLVWFLVLPLVSYHT